MSHRIPLESSGQFSLVVESSPLSLTLCNDSDDLRSPLFHALQKNLGFGIQGEHQESRIRLAPGRDRIVVESPTSGIEVRLEAEEPLSLMEIAVGDGGPRVTVLHTLSPIEARFLADNGYPHPLPGPLPAATALRTDLHTHFAGCIEADDLVRIGIEHGVTFDRARLEGIGIRVEGDQPVLLEELPEEALVKLRRSLAAPIDHQITYTSMKKIYHYRRPITKHPGAFIALCQQVAEDYRDMGVTRVELSLFDIAEARRLRAVHEHLPGIEDRTGVTLRFLGAMSRHDDLEWDLDYIDRIRELGPSRYLAGVDFMGRESNSTWAFVRQIVEVAKWAHDNRPGFVIRVHAGENPAHPENVRVAAEAVEGCDVQLRIGHGLYGVDDRTLVALKRVGAIVEFNLSSNYALNNIQMTGDAPLWKYLDGDVPVVLATDGYGIYRTSIPLEARSALLGGLSAGQLARIQAAEEAYVATRRAHEEQWTLPPGEFEVPDDRAHHHFTDAVNASKVKTRAERDQKLRGRLDEVGIPLLDAAAARDLLSRKRCISFSGAWRKSWRKISPKNRERVRALVDEVLSGLDAAGTVLLTGGTHHGVEGVVQDMAGLRGIPVLGIIVQETPPDALGEGQITHAHIVSETLYDKAAGLYRLLQEVNGTSIFIGGGNIVADEIQTAHNLQVRHLLMDGVEGASAEQARQRPHLAFRSGAEVLEAILSPAWSSHEGRYHHLGVNPTVDAVVIRRARDGAGQETLLIRRSDTAATEAGKWALPGGFQHTDAPPGGPWQAGHESPIDACIRELREETHLDLADLAESFVHVGNFEGGGRDPRDSEASWSMAQVFAVTLPDERSGATILGADDAVDARWFDLDRLPARLAFDHARVIELARACAEQAETRGGVAGSRPRDP